MRWTAILVIVLVLILGIQAQVLRNKLDTRYQAAIALLPGQPKKAYDEIKPTFQTSNLLTFGAAGRTHRDFFIVLRDKMIGRISSQRDLKIEWNGILVECLDVFHAATKEETLGGGIKESLPGHQRMIFTTLMEGKDQIAESASLGSWDAFVKNVGQLSDEGVINEELAPGASDWILELKAVDRREIAWREAMTVSHEAWGAGLAVLGLAASEDDAGPFALRLDKQIPDASLIKAEEEFGRGQRACVQFGHTFGHEGQRGAMPPEIRLVWAKLLFNIAAMRLAHLIDMDAQRSSNEASYYMVKLLVVPGTDTMPSDGELIGTFKNTVGQQLMKTADVFGALDDEVFGGEKNACLALVRWTQTGFEKTAGFPSSGAAGEYQKMRAMPMGTKPAETVVKELEAADFPLLFAR